MSAITGHKSAVYWDVYDLSSYFNQLDTEMNAKELDTTTFGNDARTRAGGIKDGSASMSGMFDASTTAVDPLMQAAVGDDTGRIVTLSMGTHTAGSRVRVFKTKPTEYQISEPADDLVTVSANLDPDGGILAGDLVTPMVTQTLASLTASAVNCGVSTSNGGFIHLHLAAVSTGVTVDSIVLQDSTDGLSFTHLATVATGIVAATAIRSELTTSTQIDQYLRYVCTLSGSDGTHGAQYALAIGRR